MSNDNVSPLPEDHKPARNAGAEPVACPGVSVALNSADTLLDAKRSWSINKMV